MFYSGLLLLYTCCFPAAPQMELYSAYADLTRASAEQEAQQINPKQGPFMAAQDMRLYMARGEQESFQVWVRGGEALTEAVQLEVTALDAQAPEAVVYQLGNIALEPHHVLTGHTAPATGLAPDVLLPAAPAPLAAHEERYYWITFHTNEQSRPGQYAFNVELSSGGNRLRSQRILVAVRDFILPAKPPLPIVGDIHRPSLAHVYGLAPTPAVDWQPLYAFLLNYGITPSIADRDLLAAEAQHDTTLLTDHLEALLAAGQPALLEVGGPQGALVNRLFKYDTEDTTALAAWLESLREWQAAQEEDIPDFLLRIPPIPISQGAWSSRYALYKYFFERASDFRPVSGGKLHPFFHPVLRHWSAPFSNFSPELMARLREGSSLQYTRQYPSFKWLTEAPEAPEALNRTDYANAFDGSPFTVWDTRYRPTPEAPLRLTFLFDALVRSDQIRILWGNDNYATDIDVYTSANGINFTPATVRWSHDPPVDAYDIGISRGVFRFANNFMAIQLVLKDTAEAEEVQLALVAFQEEDETEPDGLAPPVTPWLEVDYDRFPGLGLGRHPVEPRMIPWIAWGHRYAGAFIAYLNHWPPDWPRIQDHHDTLAQAPGPWRRYLLYPGESAVLPSLRLERLRDGIEDLAYLAALEDAVQRGLLDDDEVPELLSRTSFPRHPDEDTLSHLLSWVEARRERMGALLHDIRYRPATD